MEIDQGHAHSKRMQDLCPGHGRPKRRYGQRKRWLSRSLQKEFAGHGRRHAGTDRVDVLDRPSHLASQDAVAAGTRTSRSVDSTDSLPRRDRPLRRNNLAKGYRNDRRKAASHRSRQNVLVFQRTQFQRSRFSVAIVSTCVRHQQR